MTISYRLRKQIVDYSAQRKSSQEIASMLNVSLDQIQDWRRRYKHGHEDWVFSDHQKFWLFRLFGEIDSFDRSRSKFNEGVSEVFLLKYLKSSLRLV